MNQLNDITLNQDELNELWLHSKLLKAYLYLKANSIPEEKKTRKILWGGFAAHASFDRNMVNITQAKRIMKKLEEVGLISSTDEPQIYKLNLCTTAENLGEQRNALIQSDLQTQYAKQETIELPEHVGNAITAALPDEIGPLFEGLHTLESLSNKGSTPTGNEIPLNPL